MKQLCNVLFPFYGPQNKHMYITSSCTLHTINSFLWEFRCKLHLSFLLVCTLPRRLTISMPLHTLPKIVCFPGTLQHHVFMLAVWNCKQAVRLKKVQRECYISRLIQMWATIDNSHSEMQNILKLNAEISNRYAYKLASEKANTVQRKQISKMNRCK
jgi:hypothetical protein